MLPLVFPNFILWFCMALSKCIAKNCNYTNENLVADFLFNHITKMCHFFFVIILGTYEYVEICVNMSLHVSIPFIHIRAAKFILEISKIILLLMKFWEKLF